MDIIIYRISVSNRGSKQRWLRKNITMMERKLHSMCVWLTHWGPDNACHFVEDIFKCILLNESYCILIKMSFQLTIRYHWFRLCLVDYSIASYYLNQSLTDITVIRSKWVKKDGTTAEETGDKCKWATENVCRKISGPRLNIKTVLSTYGDFHVKDKTAVRTSYL